MRVSTLIFSAFSAVLLISAASADTCLLKSPGLVLSNGWELSYPWSQETINYFCSCAFSSEWTTVKVTPLESGATVTLSLNGNLVPGFSWPQESPRLNFNVGENLIDVHVTCQDCDLHHTITCTRGNKNNNIQHTIQSHHKSHRNSSNQINPICFKRSIYQHTTSCYLTVSHC